MFCACTLHAHVRSIINQIIASREFFCGSIHGLIWKFFLILFLVATGQYFQFYSLSPTNIYIPCGVVYQIKVIFWIQFFWKISQNPFKLIYIYISLWNIQSPMKIVKWLLLSLKWKKNNSSSIDLKFIIITDFSPPYRFMDGVCSALMLGRDEEVITWKSLRRVHLQARFYSKDWIAAQCSTLLHIMSCVSPCVSHIAVEYHLSETFCLPLKKILLRSKAQAPNE